MYSQDVLGRKVLQDADVTLEEQADEAHLPLEIVREYVRMPGTRRRVTVEL